MISEYIDIIRNEQDGETVRNAIIDCINELVHDNSDSIVLIDSYEDFMSLDDATKNNGSIYLVSGVEVEDGDNIYFGTK